MIHLLADSIVALLLIIWLVYLFKLHRRLKDIVQAGIEQKKLMTQFTDTIIAGQKAARCLSDNLQKARAEIEILPRFQGGLGANRWIEKKQKPSDITRDRQGSLS